ncbi:MAG: 3'-5' exonuclease [Bacteroidetes bacterium]|nr:3'-5' exonuclease [Bacteroidota bacterium]MBM3424132.1 3'-5' exonuclease [Bacteroidota bacterium]
MSLSNLENILFLDIETVPQTYYFEDLSPKVKTLFETKNRLKINEEKTAGHVYQDLGGIQSEFGKIVCISVGMVKNNVTGRTIRVKSFAHDDEFTLLTQFKRLLDDHYKAGILCGHNAKEFDFPYLCRRMLIHGIALPLALDIAGKKPWDIKHLDTMELWKFGDYKAFTSLALLCHVFGVPTPKDDITGADVARVYYEDKDLARIAVYCEKDVIALIQVFLKMHLEPLVEEGNITQVPLAPQA